MARRKGIVYIGIGSHVVALDGATGTELWRTKLKGATLVTVHVDGDAILAGASGEVFCLDAATGALRWHNKLKGLGMGYVTFASSSAVTAAAAAIAAQAAATVAATS